MIGASKILTVSYGTFSCTLEGFDDPFNTMKAIAEYFRDLAAEDRYFGAEPPTPDAAMLHRIAEREIQRRVEAKINENGVVLRAADLAPDASRLPPPSARQPEPEPVVAAAPQAPEPVVAEAPTAPDPIEESVAAKLSRIRSAVAQARSAAPVPAMDYVEDEQPAASAKAEAPAAPLAEPDPADIAELEPAALAETPADDAAEDSAPPLADPVALASPEADLLPEELTESWGDADLLPEDFAAAEDEDFTAPAEAEVDFGSEDFDTAALAAALAAEAPAEAAQPEEDTFAAHADEARPEENGVVTLAEATLTEEDDFAALAVLAAEDNFTPIAETGDMAAPHEPEADFGAELDLDEAALLTPAEASAEDEDEDEEDDLSGLLAALEPAEAVAPDAFEPEPVAAQAAPIEAEFEEDLEDPQAGPAIDILDPEPEAEASATKDRLERARARVIRIRRLPAAAETADILPTEPEAALSPEAEADLMRELAEVEAEAAGAPPEAAPEPAADLAPHPVAPVRPARPVRPVRLPPAGPRGPLGQAEGEEAMSRLIAETNTKMDGPENRRRLSAIAHLKAAVAATVAERRAGAAKPVNEAEREDPYREDLSRMVRPAPGQSAGASRPTPLVLVSEQRVDRPAEAARPEAAPVRPRRVAGLATAAVLLEDEEEDDFDTEDNLFDDSRGFAEFAERLGAQGLPALLEAAAAYAACVEGRPHFSRPQLMRQIAAMGEEGGIAREDSLRSFGSLLRDGRIVKVKRGQYALAESSHLLAEARKIAG